MVMTTVTMVTVNKKRSEYTGVRLKYIFVKRLDHGHVISAP